MVLMGAHPCRCMDAMRCSHTFPTRAARSPAACDRNPEASSFYLFYSRCEDAMLVHSRDGESRTSIASVDVSTCVGCGASTCLAKGQPEIKRWPDIE